MKYTTETDLLLTMLDISHEDYVSHLRHLAKLYHQHHGINPYYGDQKPFASWWYLQADKINASVLDKISLNGQHEYRMHLRNGRNNHFIYGMENIQDEYSRQLVKLVKAPFNQAVFELCNTKKRITK